MNCTSRSLFHQLHWARFSSRISESTSQGEIIFQVQSGTTGGARPPAVLDKALGQKRTHA